MGRRRQTRTRDNLRKHPCMASGGHNEHGGWKCCLACAQSWWGLLIDMSFPLRELKLAKRAAEVEQHFAAEIPTDDDPMDSGIVPHRGIVVRCGLAQLLARGREGPHTVDFVWALAEVVREFAR